MIDKPRLTLTALLAVLVVLVSCSSTLGGTAVAASALPTSTAAVAAGVPSEPIPSVSAQSSKSAQSPAAFGACPAVATTDSAGIAACLRTSVSAFWSDRLHQAIDQPVVVNPTSDQIPTECQQDVVNSKAFTCRSNETVYINESLITQIGEQFGVAEVPYALATVVSHEVGHVVQGAVHQPGYDEPDKSDALSQQIELQADCLSGVWVHSVVAARKLDRAAFVTVSGLLITSISTDDEIVTHGTPAQRAASLAKGLTNGRTQDCELATTS